MVSIYFCHVSVYLYCTRTELKLIDNYNASTAVMHGSLEALLATWISNVGRAIQLKSGNYKK